MDAFLPSKEIRKPHKNRKNMMKIKTYALLGATSLLGTVTSQATAVIDSGTMMLSGTIYTVDNPEEADFINANTTSRVRWTAQNQTGSATTTTLSADPAYTSSDHYWTLAGSDLQSGAAPIPTTAAYVQIDFTLSGGWVVGTREDQIFRQTDLTGGTGSSTPTDQNLLPWDNTPGAAINDGSYSVIFDLTDLPDAGTTWNSLRYDFFNEADANNPPHPNAGGKTFTLNAVTYSTAIAPIPEPSAALLGALGMLGLLRRRR